jgi:hypothetical protein
VRLSLSLLIPTLTFPIFPLSRLSSPAVPSSNIEFEHAIQLFIKHSDREEEDILKRLKEKLTPEENDKLAQDFLTVRFPR